MAFPDDWNRVCALTIDNTQVDGLLTDFPVRITEDMLPSEMLDSDGTHPAQANGGDIRFTSDEAGTTQLPCEVVEFTTATDPANGTAEIWVKVPSVSSTVDTTIYVWYDSTSGTETQPAVTDTYGRNAVWSDYIAVYHLAEDGTGGSGSIIDSTGNGHNGTPNAVSNTTGPTGDTGGAFDFNGSTSYVSIPDSDDFALLQSADPDFVVSCWINSDNETADTNGDHIVSKANEWAAVIDNKTSSNGLQAARFNTWGGNSLGLISDSIPVGSWSYLVHYLDPGSTISTWVDGAVEVASGTLTDVSYNDTSELVLGAYDTGSSYGSPFDGKIDEVRIRDGNITRINNAWVDAEYNNQKASSTFITAGTPADAGSTTTTVTPVADSLTITDGTLSVSINKTVTPVGDTLTITDGLLSVSINKTVTPIGDSLVITDGTLGVSVNKTVTPVPDSLTITDGSLTVSITDGTTTVTPVADNLTISDGSLVVTAYVDKTITPVADALTITDGTLPVSASVDTTVTPIADSLSITDGALSVSINKTITPIADSLVITDGTLLVSIATNKLITPIADTLTITDGTLSVSSTVSLLQIYNKLIEIENRIIVLEARDYLTLEEWIALR